jgi:hypothetical protein
MLRTKLHSPLTESPFSRHFGRNRSAMGLQ